jgi:putative transposase
MLDPVQFVLIAIAGWMNERQQQTIEYRREENRVLREQLGNRRMLFNDDQRRRLAVRAKRLGRKLLAEAATLVTPDTLLAWHRKLIAQKYDGHEKRGPRRPRTDKSLEALVVRMAEENRSWSYRRIQGAISNLGHKLARSTIADMLHRHGIEPAPERSRKTTWKEFLSQHWELLVAADFFTVEVWTAKGLKRFLVLFFLDLASRRVEIAGVAAGANGLWMSQIGRKVTDAVDGILNRKRYLIHDRDPLFTREFQNILASVGVNPVKLPPQSPNLNAYAERFVRSIKEACLDRLIFLARVLSERPFEISSYIITKNETIRAKAISSYFLELYSPKPRLTRTLAVRSGWVGCSSTITEKRHEDRAAADPSVWLLSGWIALPRGVGSEAHDRRALVLVAGPPSPLGSVGSQPPIYSGRLRLAVLRLSWPTGRRRPHDPPGPAPAL